MISYKVEAYQVQDSYGWSILRRFRDGELDQARWYYRETCIEHPYVELRLVSYVETTPYEVLEYRRGRKV